MAGLGRPAHGLTNGPAAPSSGLCFKAPRGAARAGCAGATAPRRSKKRACLFCKGNRSGRPCGRRETCASSRKALQRPALSAASRGSAPEVLPETRPRSKALRDTPQHPNDCPETLPARRTPYREAPEQSVPEHAGTPSCPERLVRRLLFRQDAPDSTPAPFAPPTGRDRFFPVPGAASRKHRSVCRNETEHDAQRAASCFLLFSAAVSC